MRIINYLFLFSFLACSSGKIKSNGNDYFDTKSFFDDQIKSLHAQHVVLEKQLMFNGKNETVISDSINWEKELNAFLSIDLLKPSYVGRFSKDSITVDENFYLITYECDDKRTDLKKAELNFDMNTKKLRSIIFLMRNKNAIFESEKQLIYFTDSAYIISGMQNIKLVEGAKYLVKGRFLKR